jgi:uncharacterized membrane protein
VQNDTGHKQWFIEVRVAGAAMLQVALAGPLARVAQNMNIHCRFGSEYVLWRGGHAERLNEMEVELSVSH